jgi:TolB-like protein
LDLASWVEELRRRRVFRALVAWGVIAFAVLQVVEPLQHALRLSEGLLPVVVWVLGLGFPVVAALAWTFDLGPGGVTRSSPHPDASLSGKRATTLLLALGVLAAAPGIVFYFVWPGTARRAATTDGTSGEASTSKAAAGVPQAPSIAVLPFSDMSASRDQEYMGDGLAEEILNLLAQVEGLQVAGRTSSFSFKGKAARLEEIGRELRVAHVLEGSVRRAGQRIRVTAQLVKASDGFHVWSQDFDRDLSDVLALQDEIARAVVGAIAPRLTGRAQAERGSAAPAPEAYAAYLEGLQGIDALELAGLQKAQESLERAVELAPRFAPAHAVLARVYGTLAGYFVDTPMDVTRLASLERASAERALALDPGLAEAYAARGRNAFQYAWEWDRALEDTRRAVELSPGSADARSAHGQVLLAVGRVEEGMAELRRSLAADPLNQATWHQFGGESLDSGDLEHARESLAQLERLAPNANRTRWLRGVTRLAEDRCPEALADFRALTMDFARLTGVAICEHKLGHDAASRAAVAELETRLGGSAAWQVVQVRAQRGEADLAFEWLERARVQHDAGVTGLLRDRYVAPLRGDPRWKPFVRRMRLPE